MSRTIKDFDLLEVHTNFFNIRNIKRIDLVMTLLVLALAAVGLAVLYSASRSTSVTMVFNLRVAEWPYYQKQGLFLLAGIFLSLVFMCLDSRFLLSLAPVMYTAFMLLLLAVILVGTEAKGGQRWLPVGPFRLQPSEQTKIVVIYMLAWYLSMVKERIQKFPYLMIAFAIVGVPAVLILKQPSLGVAMTLIPLAFVMSYAAGCKGWHLALICAAGILIMPKAFEHLEPYQQTRLISFIYPSDYVPSSKAKTDAPEVPPTAATPPAGEAPAAEAPAAETPAAAAPAAPAASPAPAEQAEENAVDDNAPWQIKLLAKVGIKVPEADPKDIAQGSGWQTRQSKITVGSGGFYGKGFTKGTQTMLNYLPEHHTDFIFSLLAEEKGFIGAVAVIALFAAFLLRGLQFAKDCQDMAGTLLGVGVVTILAFHVFVNVAITIGVMPVTGIPLPFLSYGGNFYLTTMMAVGMLLNIPVRKQLFD